MVTVENRYFSIAVCFSPIQLGHSYAVNLIFCPEPQTVRSYSQSEVKNSRMIFFSFREQPDPNGNNGRSADEWGHDGADGSDGAYHSHGADNGRLKYWARGGFEHRDPGARLRLQRGRSEFCTIYLFSCYQRIIRHFYHLITHKILVQVNSL